MNADPEKSDPRSHISSDDLAEMSRLAAPSVARSGGWGDAAGLAIGIISAVALGAVTMIFLARDNTREEDLAPQATASDQGEAMAPAALTVVIPPAPPQPAAPPVAPAVEPRVSRAMPMIIDNTSGVITAAAPASGVAPASPTAAAVPSTPAAQLSQDEQFTVRAGSDAPAAARAVSMINPGATVVQGVVIPAVLETALNSDLPGFARAVVSSDVRGFDGKRILIPRGSRLIGQYKSGLAIGQSRAFIIWTRLIRTDGVSVQLASPVVDSTGAVGLPGKVDRHFFQRFGSAMLLSVVGALPGAFGDASSNTLVIGTSAEAQSAAAMALQTDGKIPPTIRIAQGTAIQVFTSRDLDFSGV